ncbi:13565_t:CDS:2 [Gigaspora rosea]|nr:13565_t:CDS:2 [Gigaspora rosea]
MNYAIKVAKNPSDEVASHKLESFRIQLKEELEKMSESWCRRSKMKWIEKGNGRYERDTLLHIRDFYEKLYETEEIDMVAVNRITNNLPQVGEEWNLSSSSSNTPMKRGPGRPRKTPLPSIPHSSISPNNETIKTPLDELREAKIKEKEAQLAQVVDEHDSLVRELYYMESFNMLLCNLDPQKIKQDNSERMVKHRESIVNLLQKSVNNQFDSASLEPSNSNRSTRRSSRVDSSKNRGATLTNGMSSYSLRRRHSQFHSFEDYYASFVTLDDEDMTSAEEELRAQKEAEIQYRIMVLRSEGRLNRVDKPAPEPQRPKVHRDYLLEAVTHHAKYFNKGTETKLRTTRQISKAVLQHFNKLANQGPREKKLEEKRIRKLAKTTSNLVKQKWKTVESIILAKHKELLREQQEREGKRHLNLLLEHSTHMLEVQHNELVGAHSTRVRMGDDENYNETENLDMEDSESDLHITEYYSQMSTSSTEMDDIYQSNEDDESSLDAQDLEEDSEEDTMRSLIEEPENSIKENPNNTISSGCSEYENRESDEQMSSKQKISEISNTLSEPPTGTTLSTANVRTQIPPLLRGQLREYQHVGLDWLASLYNNGLNGILADEMGLGKTIQTIALLAHLAYEKGDWGPHLIVVPTSVIINWEMEFKKWCPGFIILTYYGSPKERREKRIGWMREHSFHVCITSYHLVVLDQVVFKKKKWHYLILDEAHNIKNFQSQRWKTLLNFNSERRLLLTGTPLQNNLMELWSLLYFLMPNGVSGDMPLGFANQKEFQEWFSRPVDRIIENNEQFDDETLAAVQKLHTVLRPYLLRRLKIDVEKQLPAKHHHIIKCRLSKRQRFLYDDFMSRAKTKETLQSGNFLSIINCLMQLRKVCNHPDLFEVRPIRTSFAMSKSAIADYEVKEFLVRRRLLQDNDTFKKSNLEFMNFVLSHFENNLDRLIANEWENLDPEKKFLDKIIENRNLTFQKPMTYCSLAEFGRAMEHRARLKTRQRWDHLRYINGFRLRRRPIYGTGLIRLCRRLGSTKCDMLLADTKNPRTYMNRIESITDLIVSNERRYSMMEEVIKQYAFVTPAVVARDMASLTLAGLPDELRMMIHEQMQDIYHPIRVKLQIAFPDKRLLQYDCGKLQELDRLLRELKEKGHRALIFTQMTRVLDILEIFLNIHGHRYLRLDGATKIEQRQILTERFNHDPKILVFILSTRSGGLGINLTGADTVIFYDSDWNPCMDRQCQDRCHRIGQTREVNIYRFVNGEFTTDYFQKLDWRELVSDIAPHRIREMNDEPTSGVELEQCLAEVEDDTDVTAAQVARNEMDLDLTDFAEVAETPVESSNTAAAGHASSVSTAPSPNEIDEANDDKPDHVDYYMLRFMERELGLYVGFSGLPNPEGDMMEE